MMANIKTKQIESEIHQKISMIIADLDNQAASSATVTEVILNNDHSIAKIYVSFLKDDEKNFFELKKAIGYIRKELASSIKIKKTPFIELHLDEKLKEINKMEALIDKLNK